MNTLFLIVCVLKKDIRAWWFVCALVFCWSTLRATFQISHSSSTERGIKVLSYNTRVFNVYNHLGKKDTWKNSKDMMQWIVAGDFDIMCFQEFYYEPKHPIFNTISKLKSKRKYYHYFHKTLSNTAQGQFGMAIFSKYKIIKSGTVAFDPASNNQMLYIDVLIKKDTLRVYNCHLISNSLDAKEMPNTSMSDANQGRVRSMGGTLKRGFGKRGRQVDALVKHLKACPYKVILCGDINDLPYSYTYRTLSAMLDNCFEAKGNGFGFTFNGKIPFLRIDNIFVSDQLKTCRFSTHSKVNYSDHFPVSAVLELDPD